ncbi:MAG: NlpC/P60 family protein [Actinomycetota bacterium]|nr:NlpC/P60 family protein [Actinomycetota bacterium]
MRWLVLVLSAVSLSTGVAALVSLFVASENAYSERGGEESAARAQYSSDDYVEPLQGESSAPFDVEGPETGYSLWPAQGGNVPEAGSPGSVSEGSISGARAPAEALSIMQPSEPYSQIVDNASPARFSAWGWEERSGRTRYLGKDYSYVDPSEVGYPARFRVEIPATDHYTVYARWPAAKRNNAATLFGVSTASGIKWIKVDQRRDGGMWVRLGAYKMEAGDRYAVQVSGYRARGRVVADAVMVVRGTQVPPEVDPLTGGPPLRGQEVVQRARDHIGTPYVHSPPGPCEAHRSEDCSCLTSLVYGKWLEMVDHPVEQWRYGRQVARSNLRPGDLVFFKEAGWSNPITHVGIYSGRGNIIHASSYWGAVVERPMEHVSGYYGAKRLERN